MLAGGGEVDGADGFVCLFPRGSYTPTRWALFSILPLVYCDKFVCSDIGLIHPLVVSGRIVLPSYEVLRLLSSAEVAFSEDLFNFPLFLSFDQFGRWFKEIGSVFVGLFVRRKKRRVKHVVDSPCFREADPVCDVGDLGDYLERSVSLWG